VLQRSSGGARPLKFDSPGSRRTESAFLPCITEEREVALMRTAVTMLIVLTLIATFSVFGFSGVVTPLATAAIWFIPAIFAVSVVIGFASRRRTWFG